MEINLMQLTGRVMFSHSCVKLLAGAAREVDGRKTARGGEDRCFIILNHIQYYT